MKESQEGFIACACTEQTGLLYLCRAAAWAVHLSPPVPRLRSSSVPPLRIKWLFVLPQQCLSLVSPPPPSPSFSPGTEGYFVGWILSDRHRSRMTVVISKMGVQCKIPPSLSTSHPRETVRGGQICLAPVSASALVLHTFHGSRNAVWIVIHTGNDASNNSHSFE